MRGFFRAHNIVLKLNEEKRVKIFRAFGSGVTPRPRLQLQYHHYQLRPARTTKAPAPTPIIPSFSHDLASRFLAFSQHHYQRKPRHKLQLFQASLTISHLASRISPISLSRSTTTSASPGTNSKHCKLLSRSLISLTPPPLKTKFKAVQTPHNVILHKIAKDVNTYFDFLSLFCFQCTPFLNNMFL